MEPRVEVLARGGAIAVEQNRVLRNTYLLLALTMVPTVIGAAVGMATGGIIVQHPILSFLLMLGAVIGLQFAIAAHRYSGLGVALLLALTFLLGWFLGPLLTAALSLRNGPQLVGLAAAGTGIVFFVMGAVATDSEKWILQSQNDVNINMVSYKNVINIQAKTPTLYRIDKLSEKNIGGGDKNYYGVRVNAIECVDMKKCVIDLFRLSDPTSKTFVLSVIFDNETLGKINLRYYSILN